MGTKCRPWWLSNRFGHGIGRGGDLSSAQPKAAGSSLIVTLANSMVYDALRIAGRHYHGRVLPIVDWNRIWSCKMITNDTTGLERRTAATAIILPVSTGMALMLALLSIKNIRPSSAKYVLWPRIDQKSCLKCITAAGLTPVVVENVLEGDELRTDLHALEHHILQLGKDQIVCVLSTSSCFAPRAPDRYGIGHVL